MASVHGGVRPTWLQGSRRDVERRAPGPGACLAQRDDLGVVLTGALVVTRADELRRP